ncbi:amino acid adenylation domain-containing protein [Polyangium jinanense]|uniref:non-ribosomal peptide synthetase n=1 Tax=Polyangium jinanense TaxID=2829994 RepID=UPI0023418351|nr:non-ribosomal peptide synthetase [Polyangium jinanense]MDC3955553.1 amino acid adenylation domain-containing protein [Polyangium jinanense]
MSAVEALLGELHGLGVRFWIEEDRLRFRAPEGALTPALREAMAAHKGEIRSFLLRGWSRKDQSLPLEPASRQGPLPLTFGQQRLWFLDQMGSGTAYNMPLSMRFEGPLDIDALSRSLSEIVRRHESLRTTFVARGGEPAQVIRPPQAMALPLVDLCHLSAAEQDAEVARRVQAEGQRLFDLASDTLLRASLLRLAEGPEPVHVLLSTMHHIASDGWSMGVFFRELEILYRSFVEGRASPLPDLHLQVADVAVWQRRVLTPAVLAPHIAYWKNMLDGAPAVLELPADRPRQAASASPCGLFRFRIEPELTSALRALGQDAGATLFMTLLAAFQVLLARCSGLDDVVVGTPIAGRNRQELEPLIGLFVNSLPMRADISDDPTFLGHLGRVKQITQDAYAHQDLPFDKLVEALSSERSASHHPVYQVAFALHNTPRGAFSLPGLRTTPLHVQSQQARLDLEIHLDERDGGLDGLLFYDTGLFDAATVEPMIDRFRVLLEGIVADPRRRVGDLPLLGEAERRRVLVEGNETAAAYPDALSAHELIEAQARRTPDAIAVLFDGGDAPQTLTYRALVERAHALAHHLRARGIRRGQIVGICLDPSLDRVVGLLGILAAGGAYLPLDPAYPRERLGFMLEDARPEVVVTHTSLVEKIPASGIRFVCLDRDASALEAAPRGRPESGVRPDDLAYVIYTSGTTGKPKGVLLSHRGLVNVAEAQRRIFELGAGDRVPQLAPLGFDAATFEIWLALASGATLCLGPREDVLPGEPLGRFLSRHRISMATLTPSALAALPVADLPALRTIAVAGEACTPALVEAWARGRRFFNLYGPTEATIWSTANPCAEPADATRIGCPIPNTQVYVLDRRQKLVPFGTPGELYIGGVGVARGYLHRPELTNERFVPNPFGEGKLYRTGDLVRRRAEGHLEFLGRVDDQVKIRGHRIELGEIESILGSHPAVREAVVVAREDRPGDKRLVAYVVPASSDVEAQASHVEQWRSLYEETYGQTADVVDPTFDIRGWSDSYTGAPIPAEAMHEWVEATVADMRALAPRRVLEIGCGSGLLLFRLAPTCACYLGTDLSGEAVARLERVRRTMKGLEGVTVEQRAADDFQGIPEGAFDVVLINSVVQYFPSVDYLIRVLEGATRAVRPGGAIYLGDVRNHALFSAYHASVQRHRAPDDLDRAGLAALVEQRMLDEEELLIDPAFFLALSARLPQIGAAEVRVKRGRHSNELTRFRYQVVLRIAGGAAPPFAPAEHDVRWAGFSVASLHRHLAEALPASIVVRDVPDARVEDDVRTVAWLVGAHEDRVSHLRQTLSQARDGVDPEALWSLADELGYTAQIGPSASGTPGAMDVVFWQRDADKPTSDPALSTRAAARPWHTYTNNPLRGKIHRRLWPRLAEHLRATLPEVMIPAAWVTLDALPLTPNGKVNRRALPPPVSLSFSQEAAGALPRTPTQEILAGIWREVLGLSAVGIHDRFFDLGGHSLLLTQVAARARKAFERELPLSILFEHTTIAALAAWMDAGAAPPGAPLVASETPVLRPAPRNGALPLSAAQERLWFLNELQGSDAAYNMPMAFRVSGPLDVAALERSLAEIVRRHESLRTNIVTVADQPTQIIRHADFRLSVLDLRSAFERAREATALRLTAEEAARPFDLANDPLFRATLLRLHGETEHILLVVVHHVVSDGGSMGILVRELEALYDAFRAGLPSPLLEPSIQYADFAVWQRACISSGRMAEELAYWKRKLEGAPPSPSLPRSGPRPERPSSRGAAASLTLPASLHRRLRAFSQKQDVTLFVTLLAAFELLLARLSRQYDVVVGTPVAHRNRVELEGVFGLFLNSLVLRTDLSGSPTFATLVQRVRRTTVEAFAHQDLPFEKLVAELSPSRDLRQSPFFQVLFNMVPAEAKTPRLTGVEVSGVTGLGDEPAKFDLSLYVSDARDELEMRAVYKADLFAADTIAHVLEQFRHLLAQVCDDPTRPIDAFSLVTPSMQAVLPDMSLPLPERPIEPVPARVARIAAEAPDRRALARGGAAWSYRELVDQAAGVVGALEQAGIEPGRAVAVSGPRSFGLIAAMLGVLAAGGALLLLDPRLSPGRREGMLTQAGARHAIVVVPEGQAPAWQPPEGIFVVNLDPDRGLSPASLAARPTAFPALAPDAPAYIFFTSGTTGTPKGVVGLHKGLAHFLQWQGQTFGIGPDDRAAQLTALSFDVVLRDVFVALVSGGTLVLPPDDDPMDGRRLFEWLERESITLLHSVPSLAQAWLADAPEGRAISGLRYAFFAGEPLTDALVLRFRERAPGCQIINLYGPTETTLAKCAHVVPPVPRPGVQPVGFPLPDTQALVLRGDELCGAFEPGEIVIRTPFRTRGYLHDPDEQARRFQRNPRTDDPNDCLYRTGDIGRYRLDGSLDILGRTDDQVKIRGVRVELRGIEATLCRHPDVAQAVVVAEGEGIERRLVAYVVPRGDEARGRRIRPDGSALRKHLLETLADSIVPSAFVWLDELPLLPNGKVDRRALPRSGAETTRGQGGVDPRKAEERMLVRLWEEVLGKGPIGVRDNFFDLGGHSLLAVRLLSKQKDLFGQTIPVSVFFQHPTIEEMARLLGSPPEVDVWAPLVAIQPRGERRPIFCVPGGHGNVHYLSLLSHHLGKDQPFFALQSVGLSGKTSPHTTMDPMVERYVDEIRAIQPRGPYSLLGHSFGGKVVFAMAQHLHAMGERSRVVVLDSIPPGARHMPERAWDEVDVIHEIITGFEELGEGSVDVSHAELAAMTSDERLAFFQRHLERISLLPPGSDIAEARGQVNVYQASKRLVYEPNHPAPIPLLYLAAEESGAEIAERKVAGFSKLVPVTARVVPGGHVTMLREPHVRTLASVLSEYFTDAG